MVRYLDCGVSFSSMLADESGEGWPLAYHIELTKRGKS